ncbi:MAG: hypothetical protein Kow0042_09560 [Calditrichia bacterium]
MKLQTGIIQYFENTIRSIKKMEKNSEVFSELKNISRELELLEQYVKTTLTTLENNFNSFVLQINLLSELIEFQRSVMGYKSSEKMMMTMLEFLQRNVSFDHGFIAFKLKEDDPEYIITTNRQDQIDLYKEVLNTPEIGILVSLVKERDMAYLISDVQQFYGDQFRWDLIRAQSLIIFPIKVRGKALGVGFLVRQNEQFELNHLSFVNLNIGLISLLVYQHYYFSRLKTRLFKQFRLRKVLEDVKYAEFFEKGPLFIFSLDSRHVILHANTAVSSHLNISEEMLIGDNFLGLIPKSHRFLFQKILEETEEGKVQNLRSPIMSNNGFNPIMEFYVSRFRLQDRFGMVLVFAIDITESYYKEQLEKRNAILDELDQLSRTLVGEFNNLLTIIVPNISLLRTGMMIDHPYQSQLETMETAARRSANFIHKFLNYSLDEFESFEEGNLNKIIRSFLATVSRDRFDNIQIKMQLDPGLKNIVYYPLRLKKLLQILLENSVLAVKSKEDAEIRFSTQYINQEKDGLVNSKPFYLKAGQYAQLTIYDNGCGIPEKSLSQVFKPFYSTRIKNEGVGLGLFIAYNIVKDMKGEIFIESEYGQYTAVHVYLPVKEVEPLDRKVVEKKKLELKVQPAKPTVLVVDDEYNIRSMMKEIMEMHGFRVYTAGNGRDGVDIYQRRQEEIDLVILDMVMPVMDGRAAFIEIKKINPKQKIFIISGYSQREDLDEMLQKGAVGFMRKPFQVNEIVTKVKEILNI